MAHKDQEIPTVTFCEMVTHPQLYFDKTIRLSATLEPRIEGTTMTDVRCMRRYDDQIGVGAVKIDDEQLKSFNQDFRSIRSGKVAEQPRVTVIGMLRNVSRRDFQSYRYRFDIVRFEKIDKRASEMITMFSGTLEAGNTYRATVHGDRDFGLALVSPLRVAIHHAVRLEWTNLKNFRALARLRDRAEQQIIFRVSSDDIHQIAAERWNRTLQLKILLVE
jgi:hypothetical protein